MNPYFIFFVLLQGTVEIEIWDKESYGLNKASDTGVKSTASSSSVCLTVLKTYDNSGYTAYMVDDTIQLACSLTTSDVSPNISQFCLVHHGTGRKLEPSFMEGNQAIFEIMSATVNDTGQYDCYYGDCSEPNSNWTSFMEIQVVDLTRPELHCMSVNIYPFTSYNITCAWSRNDEIYSSEWLLQYAPSYLRSDTDQPFQNCSTSGLTETFTQFYQKPTQSCYFIVNDFWATYKYQIHLREYLFLGGRNFASNFTYTIPVNTSIVKVNPVFDFGCAGARPREMTLTWQFDGSTLMSLWCKLEYWQDGSSPHVSTRFEIASPTPESYMYVKAVLDLEPFTLYTFKLWIRWASSPYWSEPAIFEGWTLAEAPAEIPTNVGYTSRVLDQNDIWREIILFWEPLQAKSWYGPNGSYIVNVTCEECILQTEELPANSTSYTTKLKDDFLSQNAYTLTIQTRNDVGLSEMIESVNVLAVSEDNKPESVQAVELETNVYFVTVKDTRSRSTQVNYTLYWCQGYLKKDTPFCVSNYHSELSSENNFTVRVNLPSEQYPWFFGASIHDRYQSSSIVWAVDQPYGSSSVKVPMEEDNTKIKVTVGIIAAGFVVIIAFVVLAFALLKKVRKRLQEVSIEDIIVETDQNENSGRQTDSFFEEAINLREYEPSVMTFEDEPHVASSGDSDESGVDESENPNSSDDYTDSTHEEDQLENESNGQDLMSEIAQNNAVAAENIGDETTDTIPPYVQCNEMWDRCIRFVGNGYVSNNPITLHTGEISLDQSDTYPHVSPSSINNNNTVTEQTEAEVAEDDMSEIARNNVVASENI